MATINQPQPVGETIITERMTKAGRRLWYQLKVIQQPERARACGSGPKSSADRRPVDPPPVVELQIFEGNSIEEGKDVTFNFNANFFLFTTLEPARNIATPRGMANPAIAAPPVLTGVPVAAMAYLDRPREAGYFLFPDLSVRHEGRYRLRFTLYEECKEEKDLDVHVPVDVSLNSFVFRAEVMSIPFSVYSAKKFPGLTESTALSRTVAEQGCRVRIRRDVRMRRRDGKDSNNFDEEDAYSRQVRNQTPEHLRDAFKRASSIVDMPETQRARSVSAGSIDHSPMQRRPSGSSPYTPTQAPPPGGYLSFGGGSAAAPQFVKPMTPVPSSPLPSPTAGSTAYNSQPSPYRSMAHPPPQLLPPPPPKPQQPADQPAPPAESLRRGSSSGNDLRRLSTSSTGPSIAPLPSLLHAVNQLPSSVTLPPMSQLLKEAPPAVNGAKRKVDEAFSQSSQQRLHDGQRQTDPHHNTRVPHLMNHDVFSPDNTMVTYPRADGSQASWPINLVEYISQEREQERPQAQREQHILHPHQPPQQQYMLYRQ